MAVKIGLRGGGAFGGGGVSRRSLNFI
jgi:hypothetical protein